MVHMNTTKQEIQSVANKIKKIGGKKVKFIILYGSFVEEKQTPLSDIDIAVYYDDSRQERFKFRMQLLGSFNDKFDIQIFQDLPLYIQKEIISSGKILYQKSHSEIFDIFFKTIKNFGDFKPRLDIYYSNLEA